MAAFFAFVASVCLSLAAGNPYPAPCPSGSAWSAAGPWGGSSSGSFGSGIGFGGAGAGAGGAGFGAPIIIEQEAPAPVVVGLPLSPNVIDHQSAPYEINYFGTPYIVKHKQSAALNVFSQTPVVVDTYAEPQIHEQCAEPAVIVEEVCPRAAAPSPCY